MKKTIAILLSLVMAVSLLTVSAAADKLSGTVATNGSTSMEKVIGILSEQFMEDNDKVTITYDATGSGTGIEAVATGTCDIGLASRNLKDAEVEKGLVATTVALDGIAIIVNENCPVDDLTVEQIAAIFTGLVTDWADFGGKGDIACIGREAGSGTRDGFESITKTTDKCVLAQELTSTGAVIAAVKSSENAIGYASYAAVEGQEGIKVLTVEGVECTAENIVDGSYVIQRPFNLVTLAEGELSEAAQAFFDYMLSEDAAELITMAGAVPAPQSEEAAQQ
ncbi:MAG: phosphate ABC transporter substrate-binding protein [Clostridiales bacterium]|nr:phosphate ABC transporter substrate-binding protein [Clostridiales bacterium]